MNSIVVGNGCRRSIHLVVSLVNHIIVSLTGRFDAMLAAGCFLKSTFDLMSKLQDKTIFSLVNRFEVGTIAIANSFLIKL